MKPQKNDPNTPEHTPQLTILNEFIDFILNLGSTSTNCKQDAIKVVECLKFIKINLAFIGYAVEHKKDPEIYTYPKDQAKGLLRDFNNTAMHFNAYDSSKLAQSALVTLVQQFENAIQAMRDRGELEAFAYKLEYDKYIGCIEERTAKALSFTAIRLTNPSSHALDDLMGQCEIESNDTSTTVLRKVNAHLKPYLGQTCIWENKDYLLDENLIKQYLTKIFDFDYENEKTFDLSTLETTLKNGSAEACLSLIEKMSPSELDEIFLRQEHGFLTLHIVLNNQVNDVCLALIDKISASTLEQALSKQSQITGWANGLRAAISNPSSLVCLALLKKITINPSKPLSLRDKKDIFFKELNAIDDNHLVLSAGLLGATDLGTVLLTAIRNTDNRLKQLSLAGCLEDIFSYHSSEVLIEFFSKLSLQQRNQLTLPLNLSQIQRRLPYFLLSKALQSTAAEAFHTHLYRYPHLKNKLISNNGALLARCIDFYFEGKGEVAPKLKRLFIECLSIKNNALSQKEKAFLDVLEKRTPSTSIPTNLDAHALWQQGLLSWHHYRQCRLQQNKPQLQAVLDRLASADLVLNGSPVPFTELFSLSTHLAHREQDIERDYFAAQQASTCIQQTKGLVKIIKPEHWQFFIDQLENLNKRPKLRDTVYNPTHKFVHLTGEIVAYQKKQQQKTTPTHTKKTSTTLLSPQLNISVFGENDNKPRLLVGLLFNWDHCQIKAMLSTDSGTFKHKWLGNKTEVTRYKSKMRKINQTNLASFVEEVKHSFRHNEVLAKVNKEAMRAIVMARDTPKARSIAIKRREQIRETLAIHLPIIFYNTSLQTLRHYTLSEQKDDIRAWDEKQKVCTPREQVSKKNVLAVYNQCLDRSWQLGWFGSCARIQNKPIPKTVALLAKAIKAAQSEKLGSFSCTWVETEQNIKNTLREKIAQSSFFKLIHGRSNDTKNFYNDLLKSLSHNT